MEFSKVVAHARVTLSLTQNQLAKRVGIATSTISRIEDGYKCNRSTRLLLENYIRKALKDVKPLVEPSDDSKTFGMVKKPLLNPFQGHELRALRIMMKMDQREFAEKVGFNPITVSLWESGRNTPTPTSVAKLREILNPLFSDIKKTKVLDSVLEPVAPALTSSVIPTAEPLSVKVTEVADTTSTSVASSSSSAAMGLREVVMEAPKDVVGIDDLNIKKFYGVQIGALRAMVLRGDGATGTFGARTVAHLTEGYDAVSPLGGKVTLREFAISCMERGYKMYEADTAEQLFQWMIKKEA